MKTKIQALEALLFLVSKDNLHEETEWSDVRGNEIW